jgi:hypothetical protein
MAFVLVLLFLTGLALSVWRLLDHRVRFIFTFEQTTDKEPSG